MILKKTVHFFVLEPNQINNQKTFFRAIIKIFGLDHVKKIITQTSAQKIIQRIFIINLYAGCRCFSCAAADTSQRAVRAQCEIDQHRIGYQRAFPVFTHTTQWYFSPAAL
ncbi:hypothetical protein D3C73_1038010 [compost metagenome]